MFKDESQFTEKIFIILFSFVAIAALFWWHERDRDIEVVYSKPGLDNAPADRGQLRNAVKIGEFFKKFADFSPNGLKGEWPAFRGKNHDNICSDSIKLAGKWGTNGPKVVWRKKLGEGHAAPVISGGKVYLLDYLEDEEADAMRCFDLRDGKELWRRWYKVPVKRNHGKSRTVPVVNDKVVISIGPKCQVMAVNPVSGDLLWSLDLTKEHGSEIPQWYTGQCPLLDGDTVVLAPCGLDDLLLGVEAETGKVLWRTKNPDEWKMSHSSVVPMTLVGKKMYVYAALGGLVGISAEKEDTGKILWKTTKWSPAVVAPTPVKIGDNRIFFTAGYGAGSAIVEIKRENDGFSSKIVQSYKPKKGLALEQQSAIFWKNRLFGILPKDAGANRLQLVAADPMDCTKLTVLSGRDKRFGLGPFLLADGKFYVLDDNGEFSMLKLEGDKFSLLGKHKVLNGHDAWGPLAIAGGYMLLRDSTEMVCIDLRASQ